MVRCPKNRVKPKAGCQGRKKSASPKRRSPKNKSASPKRKYSPRRGSAKAKANSPCGTVGFSPRVLLSKMDANNYESVLKRVTVPGLKALLKKLGEDNFTDSKGRPYLRHQLCDMIGARLSTMDYTQSNAFLKDQNTTSLLTDDGFKKQNALYEHMYNPQTLKEFKGKVTMVQYTDKSKKYLVTDTVDLEAYKKLIEVELKASDANASKVEVLPYSSFSKNGDVKVKVYYRSKLSASAAAQIVKDVIESPDDDGNYPYDLNGNKYFFTAKF